MSAAAEQAVAIWAVLVNAEEQYGLFPADRHAPPGWRQAGFTGTEDECVAFVDERWTDLRPLSLRRVMDGRGPRANGLKGLAGGPGR